MRSGSKVVAWLLMLAMLFSFSSVSLADTGVTENETIEIFDEEAEAVESEAAPELLQENLFLTGEESSGYSVFVSYVGLTNSSGEEIASVRHAQLEDPYYVVPEIAETEVEGMTFLGFYCAATGETYRPGDSIPLEYFDEREDGYRITLAARFEKAGDGDDEDDEDITYTDLERYDVFVCILAPDDPTHQDVAYELSDSFDSLDGAAVAQVPNNKLLKSPLKFYIQKGLSISGFRSVSSGRVFGMSNDYDVEYLPKPVYVNVEIEKTGETTADRTTVYEITEYVIPLFEMYGVTGTYLDPIIKCKLNYYMQAPTEDEESTAGYITLGSDTVNISMMDVVDPDPEGGIQLNASFPEYMEALGYSFDGYGELGSGEVTYPERAVFAEQYSVLEDKGVLTFAIELLYSKVDEDATSEEILEAAKEKLSAKYQNILDDEDASEGMKAVAADAIAAIEKASDKDEIIAIALDYVDKIDLQEAKDEACGELLKLFPEGAGEEILKIVSDDVTDAIAAGMKSINDCESTEDFEDIIDEVRYTVVNIMQAVLNFMDSREETVSDIGDLAEEGDSEAVLEIIEKAAQDAANAGDMDELSEILLKVQDDIAAQKLAEAREEARVAIIDEWGDDTAENVVKAAEDALAAIEEAKDIEEVNAEKEKGIEEIRKARAANELKAAKEEAKAAIVAGQGGDTSGNVVKSAENAIAAIEAAADIEEVNAVKEKGIEEIRKAKAANAASDDAKDTTDKETKTDTDVRVFPYTDVSETDACYDDIYYVWEEDLMPGITDTIFDPQFEVTRAMFVGILWYIEDEPVVNYEMTFTDVEDDMEYAEAIRWAQSLGLIEDDGTGVFEPDELITREQAVEILYRYAEFKEFDVTEKTDITEIADIEELAPEAEESMSWAIAEKFAELIDNAELDPQGTVKREELARTLHRFHVRYEEFWLGGSDF